MRRRSPPAERVEYPPCCGPHAGGRAMVITLSTVEELPALLREACGHVLDEIDRRQRYWEDMRPLDRDPRWYPPSPIRAALDAERRRRGGH